MNALAKPSNTNCRYVPYMKATWYYLVAGIQDTTLFYRTSLSHLLQSTFPKKQWQSDTPHGFLREGLAAARSAGHPPLRPAHTRVSPHNLDKDIAPNHGLSTVSLVCQIRCSNQVCWLGWPSLVQQLI